MNAAPGQSGVVLPLSIQVEDGELIGWSAVIAFDPTMLVFDSVEAVGEFDSFTVTEPRDLPDGASGRVNVAGIHGLLDGDGIAPWESGVYCQLRLCVLPTSRTGATVLDFTSTPGRREGSVHGTTYTALKQAEVGSHSGLQIEGQPLTTPGNIAVTGDALQESTCLPYDFAPTPQPRVDFLLRGPGAVRVGEPFAIELHMTTEAETLALQAAIAFDAEVFTALGGSIDPALLRDEGDFEILSVEPGSAGILLHRTAAALAPGAYRIATLDLVAKTLPPTGASEIGFADGVEHLVDPAEHGFQSEDGGPVRIVFRNTVNPDGGDDLLNPTPGGIAVALSEGLFIAIRSSVPFVRGDADADGRVLLTDCLVTLGFLFSGGQDVACADAADANDDGRLTIGDPIRTLQFLFLGGPPLPAPTGAPGLDPTVDPLSCD